MVRRREEVDDTDDRRDPTGESNPQTVEVSENESPECLRRLGSTEGRGGIMGDPSSGRRSESYSPGKT